MPLVLVMRRLPYDNKTVSDDVRRPVGKTSYDSKQRLCMLEANGFSRVSWISINRTDSVFTDLDPYPHVSLWNIYHPGVRTDHVHVTVSVILKCGSPLGKDDNDLIGYWYILKKFFLMGDGHLTIWQMKQEFAREFGQPSRNWRIKFPKCVT